MAREESLSRLRSLGLIDEIGGDLRSVVGRHSILLGKLISEIGLGNILYGIEDPTSRGQVLFTRATSDLTLTQNFASITGDGDSSKVRLLLPTLGDWFVFAVCNFVVTATDPGTLQGELFVDDSGSGETGQVKHESTSATEQVTPSQGWRVTVTTIDTPVELKAKKGGAGGTAKALGASTTLVAVSGVGGGSAGAPRDHGLLNGRGDDDHGIYALVAGTRAFTGVVAGISPTEHAHLATKEYVDSAIHFIEDYFFNNTASSYSGIYYKMLDTPTGEGESTFQSGSLGEGDDQALFNFATDAGLPGVTVLESGVYTGHIHARVTLSNKRPTKIHFEVYYRDNGSETLVATSEESAFLTNSAVEYSLHAVLAADVTIATTDRLIIKWLANVDSTPSSNVIVELFAEGTNASRFSVPVPTDVLNQVFLRQDGTKAGSASQAQDFGSNGIKADVVAESTGGVGVTLDDCLALDDDFFLGKDKTSSDVMLRNLAGILQINLGDNSDFTSLSALRGIFSSYVDALYYRLDEANPADVEISSGAISPTHQFINLQAQTGTTDDLTTVANPGDGKSQVIYLMADTGDTITLKHGSVNLQIFGGEDIILTGARDLAIGIYDPGSTKWHVIGGFRDHASDHAGGGDALYSVHQYVFTPDAAPAAEAATGTPQGNIYVSGPSQELVKRIIVKCETAAGTAFTFTLDYDSGNEDMDSFTVDTEIDEVAVGTAKGVIVSTGFTTATIAARSLIALDITVVTGTGPKDVTITLEVWRPLQT